MFTTELGREQGDGQENGKRVKMSKDMQVITAAQRIQGPVASTLIHTFMYNSQSWIEAPGNVLCVCLCE